MAQRTVSVRLTAQVQEYVAGMEQAAGATKQTAAESERLTRQREDFQQLGAAMMVVGGAITAVGLAALKTGIDYNSMQQSSRAALQTMLGSAEAVNAQMDQLDAFAKGSPFSKQTFIQAQQQMLAFGIETKKVIPYLDAMQDAVAAAGGGNQQISEIAFIMAQISSASKITAQDLLQFGQRGINAAELIGSQMGKTGAQIRADITAGTLDADQALDALAAGMKEKFGGAAANVKDTFAGAMDRVKAAWRDFSAELARPLVDPEGGGMLIDFLNGVADAMRDFEKLPEPLKNTVTGLTGLTGAALLAGGTLLVSIPKYVAFKEALDGLNISATTAKGSLAALAPVAIALAAIPIAANIARWADEMRGVTADAENLAASLKKSGDVSEELDRALTGGHALRGIGADATISEGNLRALNTTVGQLKATFDNSMLGQAMSVSMLGFGRETGTAQKRLEELDSELAELVGSGKLDLASDGFEQISAKLAKAGYSTEEIAAALPKYSSASEDAAAATDVNADALEMLAGVADAAKADVDALSDAIRGFGEDQFDVERSAIKLQDALAKLSETTADGAGSLDITTEAGRKTNTALLDVANAANDNAAAIAAMGGSTEEVEAALNSGREAIVRARMAMGEGEEQARKYADQLLMTPSQVQTEFKANWDQAIARANEVAAAIRNIPGQRDILINQVIKETGAPRGQVGAAYNEAGGMYVGGVKYFADGGIESGTYRGGRTLYGFAEPGVPWETFISGKPSERERNRQIWAETGARLGVTPTASGPQIKVIVNAAPGMDENRIVDRAVKKIERLL